LTRAEVIAPADLFEGAREESARADQERYHDAKSRMIAEFERRYVTALLERHGGKVAAAAQDAGLSKPALYALMRRAGIGS
jgi:DNA-binding NtrC family response regulator